MITDPALADREDAIDLDAARRALADPTPSIPLDEVLTLADQEDSDPYEINLSSCPWWQTRGLPDAQRGLCSHGCRDEPECQTCEPVGGWPPLPADPEERLVSTETPGVRWWFGVYVDHLIEECPARRRTLPWWLGGHDRQGDGLVDPLGTDICGWCLRVWLARNPQYKPGAAPR